MEPPQNKAVKPKQVATANSNGAGPSKKPPSKTLARQTARKRSPSPPPPPLPLPIREDEEEERSVDANDGEMRPVVERKTTQSRRAPEHAPKSRPAPKGRGKGKGKANVEQDPEAMDIDNMENATEEDARE